MPPRPTRTLSGQWGSQLVIAAAAIFGGAGGTAAFGVSRADVEVVKVQNDNLSKQFVELKAQLADQNGTTRADVAKLAAGLELANQRIAQLEYAEKQRNTHK